MPVGLLTVQMNMRVDQIKSMSASLIGRSPADFAF